MSARCEFCEFCQYPRSANDNGGRCKCKAMKRKTIDVYVSCGETPEWCPLNQGKAEENSTQGGAKNETIQH